jgi:two-component system, LytTR family, response regulator
MKAAVVDDELLGREGVELLLATYCPEVQVVASCGSAAEALRCLPALRPELLFLDIDMPGMDGFELLEQLKGMEARVIFVTAHDRHAIRAFKYLAVDYLLKPVNATALIEAVKKASRSILNMERQELLMEHMKKPDRVPEVIALPMSFGLELVKVADIMYCLAEGNYTVVKLRDGSQLLVTRQLKEFDHLLSECGFYRVHNSGLVNLKFVKRFHRSDGARVEMEDGTLVEVSRSRKDDFLEQLPKV